MSDSDEGRRIQDALAIALRYGQIKGQHHRLWVIDQMVRILAGDDYSLFLRLALEQDGYEWDEGIAP